MQSAFKTKELIENQITHILNLSSIYYTHRTQRFKYIDIDIYDTQTEDIKKYFRISNRFIDEARVKGKVLIHCSDGKSRSCAFVLAWLIASQKIKLNEGMQIIKKTFPIAINENFMQQLVEYDLAVLSKY